MANPLKFEIHIGSQLAQDIQKYTTALNSLIKMFDKKNITIGVDSRLTEIVTQLTNGFKDINTQQAEGLKNLKAITEHLSQQQKAMAGSAAMSQQSADAANKEADAYKKVTAEKEKAAAAGGQQKTLFDTTAAEKVKNELGQYQQAIQKIVADIQESINGMAKGIDIESATKKFRDSVQSLLTTLEPFQKMLSAFSTFGGDFTKVTSALTTANTELLNSLKQVSEAQKINAAATNKDSDAKQKAGKGILTYFDNVVKLERALVRLEAAEQKAGTAREKIIANNGDTSDVDRYLANIRAVIEAINKVRNMSPDVLGQKGSMISMDKNLQDSILGILKADPSARVEALNTLAQMLGKSKVELKDIIDLLSNAGPLGKDFVRVLGADTGFMKYANDLGKAVPKVKNAEQEIADAQTRLNSVISRSGDADTSKLQKLQTELQGLKDKFEKLKGSGDTVGAANLLDATYTKLIQNIKTAANEQEKLLSNTDKLNFILKNVMSMNEGDDWGRRVSALLERYKTVSVDFMRQNDFFTKSGFWGGDDAIVNRLAELREKIKETLSSPDKINSQNNVTELVMEYNKLSYAYHSCWSQLEKLVSAQERSNKKIGGKSEEQIQAEEANKWYGNLIHTLMKYQDLVQKGSKLNIDTSDLEKAIEELDKFRAKAKEIAGNKGKAASGETARDAMSSPAYVDASAKASMQASTLSLQIKQAEAAASATSRLSDEQQRLAQAFNSATKEAHGQSQAVSDLKSLMAQYFSVYGAQQLLSEMVNITGELELQRKSLEVILGSGTAASEMYSQLRDLSQQSPYTFEDLLKAHRQLAAFGIEAKGIYGTMKSLTDIGAGLDVPVERLILAYGHTKSYGYLSGIQNRQFETAGIDLVGALSDLYNRRADQAKANGQAANYTSRKDIFSMMRKREIPFEDVQEVIMDLDKPGGRFFNMQERQYNTLGGKLRNLRNNYRIMLSEMGGSSRGVWMGLVDTLNDVTGHWDKYAKVILSVASAYGIMKAAQMASGKAMLPLTAVMSEVMVGLNSNKRSASILANAQKWNNWGYWRNLPSSIVNSQPVGLSLSEQKRAGNAMVKEIINNKSLTDLQKRRIALGNQLTVQQRARLLFASGLDRATSQRIAQFGRLHRSVLSLRLGFMQAANAAKAFMASMLPQLAIIAAISGILALIAHSIEASRKAKDIAKQFRDESETNANSADEIVQKYAKPLSEGGRGLININPVTRYDAMGNKLTDNRITFNEKAMQDVDLTSDIEEMKNKLQVLSPIYDGDLLDINKMEGQKAQFEALVNKIEAIRRANEVQESISSDLANADKRVAGGNRFTRMFGDTFSTDMNDYSEAVKDMRERLQEAFTDTGSNLYTSDKDLDKIDAATGGLLTAIMNEGNLSNLREALQVYFTRVAKMTEDERNKALDKIRNVKLQGGGTADFLYWNSSKTSDNFSRSLQSQYQQLKKDALEWSRSLGTDIVSNFAKDPEGAVAAMINSVNSFLSSAGVTDPAIKQDIIDAVVDKLKQRSDFTVSGKYGDLTLQNGNIGNLYEAALVKEQFGQYLSGLNGDMTDKEGLDVFKEAYEKIETFIKDHNITIRGLGKQTMKQWLQGLYEGQLNSLRANEAWQKRALNTMKSDASLKTNISSYVDIYALADDVKKKLKEARDKLEKMIPHIKTLQVRLGIKFNLTASTSVAEINKEIQRIKARLVVMNPKDPAYKGLQEFVKELTSYATTLSTVKEDSKWLKNEGIKDDDEEKREKKREAAERKREAARRAAEQKAEREDRNQIKAFNDRINALNKARQMYEEWYNRYHDRDYAIAQVSERMSRAMQKGELLKNSITAEDFKQLDSYTSLRDILNKQQDIVSKWTPKTQNGKEQKNNVLTQIESQINELDVKEADKRLKEFSDAIKNATDLLSDAYTSFKDIRDKTGDEDFASKLTGFSLIPSKVYGKGWTENISALYALVSQKLSEIGAEPFLGNDMKRLYSLSGDNLKSEVSGLLKRGLSKQDNETNEKFKQRRDNMLNHTDAIVSIIELFNTAMRNMVKATQNAAADLYASANTYKIRRDKAQQTWRNNDEDIDRMEADGKTYVIKDEAQRNWLHRRNDVLYDTSDTNSLASLNMNPDINRMLNVPISMPLGRVRELGQKYIQKYLDAFTEGLISEDDYNNAAKKAQDAIKKRLNSTGNSIIGQMSFMGGVFFDPTKHTSDLQAMQQAASMQLAQQQSLPQGQQDHNLIYELKLLIQSLSNILSGTGGRGAIREAAQAQRNINNWSNLTPEQQSTYGGKAKKKFDEAQGDPFGFWDKATEGMGNAMGKFVAALNSGAQAVNLLSDTFDKLGLGETGVGSVISDAGDLMGGMASGAQAGAAFGPWGMAVGAGLGLLGGLAGLHDKHAQKKIDKLQDDVSKIEGYTGVISKAQERTLGYDRGDIIREYQRQYAANQATIQVLGRTISYNKEGDAGSAMIKYYNAAGTSDAISGYQQQYNLLIQKRKDYIGMYDAENSKKKKSKQALEEYKEKIAELDDQIRFFSEDLAKTLYDIDLKSWADQLSDALMTAFENGEDAAEAFDNSVTSILQGIVKKMVSVGVMEPLFEKLRVQLFGDGNGQKGSFDINNPTSNQDVWMAQINDALGDDGYVRKGIESAQILFASMETLANKYGNTLMNSNSASMSSSIKGITEQTADLLAAYLNAIRADVSVIRQIYGVKAVPFMESMSEMARSQVQYQSQIASNTLRNAEAAEAIKASTSDILYILNAVVNDTKRLSVNVK